MGELPYSEHRRRELKRSGTIACKDYAAVTFSEREDRVKLVCCPNIVDYKEESSLLKCMGQRGLASATRYGELGAQKLLYALCTPCAFEREPDDSVRERSRDLAVLAYTSQERIPSPRLPLSPIVLLWRRRMKEVPP